MQFLPRIGDRVIPRTCHPPPCRYRPQCRPKAWRHAQTVIVEPFWLIRSGTRCTKSTAAPAANCFSYTVWAEAGALGALFWNRSALAER